MNRKYYFVVLLIGCLCLTELASRAQRSQTATGGVTASGAVPNLIKYSGVLKDANGTVITALTGVTFSIYKDEQGGAPLWMETQNVQPDQAGRYTVQLGSVSKDGLPSDVFMTGEARWLAVQVAGEAEHARISLVAVPYAMKAADAETVGGKPASAFVLAQPQASSGSTSKAQSSSAFLPNVGGTGAANFIAKWTSSSNLGKSVIFQTPTTSTTPNLVGVNTQAPVAQLDAEAPATVSTGIQGVTPSTAFFAAGVFGHATGTSGVTRGIYGVADSPSGIGVHGIAATGGQFETGSGLILKGRGFGHDQFLLDANGNMRLSGGISAGGSGTIQIDAPGIPGGRFAILPNGNVGIGAPSPSAQLIVNGNVGIGTLTPGTSRLEVDNTSGIAIFAQGLGGGGIGVSAEGGLRGLDGSSIASGGVGVRGEADGSSGIAIVGVAGGPGPSAAGLFNGDVSIFGNLSVSGNVTKGAGSFKIDHPLDPANKYLSHSFVESPDMMNIYNGMVVLNARGEALVRLPDWFQALNRDFRYQLTAIGAPGPNLYIAKEIFHNRFKISGGKPHGKVSWQVAGIRHDPAANAHRIPVEEEKPEAERGYYLEPELFGAPKEKGIQWAQHRQVLQHEARLPLTDALQK